MSGLILAADLHLLLTTHDGPDADGSPSWRQAECRRVVEFIDHEAIRRERSPIIVAGDMFHTTRPQAFAYTMADLLDPDWVIPGNHDCPVGADVTSPLKMLHGNVADTPQVVEFDGIDAAFVPWFSRAFVAATYPDLAVGEQNRYMAAALDRIVADLASKKREGIPLIAITHFTVGGAVYNTGVQPQLGESSDFMVPRSVFDRPEFAHVFSGHVHKPQTLHGDFCDVTYIGSPFYSDFGEQHGEARILHVTRDGNGVRFEAIPTPAVEFCDVELVDGAFSSASSVAGKIVRIVGDAPAGEETAARLAMFTDALQQAGALHVATPAVRFTRHEARAVRLIEVDASPEAALRSYAGMVAGEYETHLDDLLAVQSELERKAIA